MIKNIVLIALFAIVGQAFNVNNMELAIQSSSLVKELIATEPVGNASSGNDTPPEPEPEEWGPVWNISESDVQKFGVWKQQVFRLAGQHYHIFHPAWAQNNTNNTNTKMAFGLGNYTVNKTEEKCTTDPVTSKQNCTNVTVQVNETFYCVAEAYWEPKGNGHTWFPIVQSVLTPDGIMHVDNSTGGNSQGIGPGKWQKMDQKFRDRLKHKFEHIKERIFEFLKNRVPMFKNYKGKFDPTQFKADEHADGSITYTVQYAVEDNQVVQATVVQPPVVLGSDQIATADQPDPEITQFIAADGTVYNQGAAALRIAISLLVALATLSMA